MILNNCTTCGRKPDIYKMVSGDRLDHYFGCKCGRTVNSDCKREWTPEVAADMWNLANPQEECVRINIGNHLPGDVAIHRSPTLPSGLTVAKITFRTIH